MSYYFSLMFKEVKNKGEAIDFASKIANLCYEKKEDMINENKFYIPSIRKHFHLYSLLKDDNIDIKVKNRIEYILEDIDNLWGLKLLTCNFIYWEKYNLLAMVGDSFPLCIKELFDNIFHFQNSSDQNYDYKEWGNISCFKEIINEVLKYSDEKLVNIFDYYTLEDIQKDRDYYLKSAVYTIIYERLELDNWLYNKPGDNFISFGMCSEMLQEKEFELNMTLKAIKTKETPI